MTNLDELYQQISPQNRPVVFLTDSNNIDHYLGAYVDPVVGSEDEDTEIDATDDCLGASFSKSTQKTLTMQMAAAKSPWLQTTLFGNTGVVITLGTEAAAVVSSDQALYEVDGGRYLVVAKNSENWSGGTHGLATAITARRIRTAAGATVDEDLVLDTDYTVVGFMGFTAVRSIATSTLFQKGDTIEITFTATPATKVVTTAGQAIQAETMNLTVTETKGNVDTGRYSVVHRMPQAELTSSPETAYQGCTTRERQSFEVVFQSKQGTDHQTEFNIA